jgi:DNA-binding NarL/FixJ family response regulator
MRAMRVVLIEDHLSYRQAFRLALEELTPNVVVGETDRAREAFHLLEQTRPDLVVVDFLLPDSDAVSLAREMRRRRMGTPMMILGRIGHPLFVRDAMRLGVRGYVLKREPLEEIVAAMEKVAAGQTHVSPGLLVGSPDGVSWPETTLDGLSVREREILCLLSDGLTSKEIARALCLSSKTVELARLVAGEGILAA